ncbi:MAG: CpXC domain-containing protein [Myxococcales bacterium]|nr:CpXC domain-containing protein [Myxococcales bacterium]
MSVVGTVRVTCPGCARAHDARLVQSVNTRTQPDDKRRLLAGELNTVACGCGRRVQLAANLLYYDPDADYYGRVCPGDDAALAEAAALFEAAGATGQQRLVPSANALVEKIKILDAGLDDWAIEIVKVLLLATVGDLDRVLLFDRVDRAAGRLHWVRFDEHAADPRAVASDLTAYEAVAARAASAPRRAERQIDRAWAVAAAAALVAAGN